MSSTTPAKFDVQVQLEAIRMFQEQVTKVAQLKEIIVNAFDIIEMLLEHAPPNFDRAYIQTKINRMRETLPGV